MHQLLQTLVGECKTVLRGVWCVPGLSSRLFSVQVHLKSACGNSYVLKFAVLVLCTLAFTLPLVDDTASGLFSFFGVAIVASPPSAPVAPAVAPPACPSKSTSAAPLDVWHHHLGHPGYDTFSQLKLHVHNFVVTGSFKLDTRLVPGCGCDTCICCNLHHHPHADTEAHTMTASGQLVHVDGASGFPGSSLVHAFVGVYWFVDDYSSTCIAIGYQHMYDFPMCFKEYCRCWYGDNMAVCALKMRMKSDCMSELSQGTFCKFADDNTIALHHSAPHEPKENSVVEHHAGVIKAMACAVSYDAGFWPLMGFLLWRQLVFSTPSVLVHVGLPLISWTMALLPLFSFFALSGVWCTTIATLLVPPPCILIVLMLSLQLVSLLVLICCLVHTRSTPCSQSASAVPVRWCSMSPLSLSNTQPSKLPLSWMMSFPWTFWCMASKWVMPQLILLRSTDGPMLVRPPLLCLPLPQCIPVHHHLLSLPHPLLHLVLKFVYLLGVSILLKMGSMTLHSATLVLMWPLRSL